MMPRSRSDTAPRRAGGGASCPGDGADDVSRLQNPGRHRHDLAGTTWTGVAAARPEVVTGRARTGANDTGTNDIEEAS